MRRQLTWRMWHFEILQAKDGRRVRRGQQGLCSLRCTSDFHFDRFHLQGFVIRAISNATLPLMILDVFRSIFYAFLSRSPAKVWLCKTQLPGKEWRCDLFCNLSKIGQWWQTKISQAWCCQCESSVREDYYESGFAEPKLRVLQKIDQFCTAMAETRRVSIYVTAAGWIEVSVDEHFTAGIFEAFCFFHSYCSEFTIVIDGIHVFWSDDFACLQSRKSLRRHPCRSQDVSWRSAMAWECRRFIGFTAVQTIRAFGRQMRQKWWKWKPWKWRRHWWRELFNGNCFVLGQLFRARSKGQGSSAYDNRETWHYYTADPTAPRFCQLYGAVLDWDLWRWTWCPLDIRRL